MKRILLILILLTLTTNIATAQKYVIKVNGNETTQTSVKYGFSNNRITLKTDINGHKVRLRTPAISKNKYLKLINIS